MSESFKIWHLGELDVANWIPPVKCAYFIRLIMNLFLPRPHIYHCLLLQYHSTEQMASYHKYTHLQYWRLALRNIQLLLLLYSPLLGMVKNEVSGCHIKLPLTSEILFPLALPLLSIGVPAWNGQLLLTPPPQQARDGWAGKAGTGKEATPIVWNTFPRSNPIIHLVFAASGLPLWDWREKQTALLGTITFHAV